MLLQKGGFTSAESVTEVIADAPLISLTLWGWRVSMPVGIVIFVLASHFVRFYAVYGGFGSLLLR